MSLKQKLESLRPDLAQAAQRVVDEWELDEEGLDPELGAGGVCDRVAEALLETVYDRVEGIEAAFGAPEGHDHEWIVVTDGREAFEVDIPPGAYETGAGYSWKKIEGARISPSDVIIYPIDLELVADLVRQEEDAMRDKLIALADALQALEEDNTATLVRALEKFAGGSGNGALAWPFPAPEVLKRPEAFISAALGWAGPQYSRTGRKGEIEASRLYLRHLMKEVAPELARTLQKEWAAAAGDPARQRSLRLWWKALVLVWQRLQDMVGHINSYEKAPGYYGG
jgi:hypothetical protein